MKRHPLGPAEGDVRAAVPVEVLLGPCLEVWQPDDDQRPVWCDLAEWPQVRVAEAWGRWQSAKSAYLDSIGLPWPRRTGTIPPEVAAISVQPWSFEYLAHHDPQQLRRRLAKAGLPPTWRPTIPSSPSVADRRRIRQPDPEGWSL